ncbi:MAG: hypothetical protein ACK5MP_09875 [Nostocoides sp.]
MTDYKAPRGENEWSRRAIINVVGVLAVHAESLTLVGAHAVLLRTMDLDVPQMPTGDGDLGVTPGLVGDVPSIEALLEGAGYEHRTTARPGLWGREPYDESDGTRSFREKIDLLAPHGLSGTASRTKRGVPALQPAHGKLAVGNTLGLELAAFNRSLVTITDFADPRLSTEIHVAEIPALILAKGSKIGERLREPRKGPVRDKDLGDLWRLMVVADPGETIRVIGEFVEDPEVGVDVRQSVEWTADVLRDPVSVERAKLAFDTFVDPAEIDRVFATWRNALPVSAD